MFVAEERTKIMYVLCFYDVDVTVKINFYLHNIPSTVKMVNDITSFIYLIEEVFLANFLL